MRSARFRHLAWVLVLVLLAGLAAPAFAAVPGAGNGAAPAMRAHVHADGSTHFHAKRHAAPSSAQVSDPGGVWPSKPPQHCPGCLTAAECAITCLGVGLLPASAPVLAAAPLAGAWFASAKPSPAGAAPAGDLDPPRLVPVR